MTTSYSPLDLATSIKDQIRFNLGDTDSSSFELQDEEITWAYTVRGNTWGATSMCALALAAKYARLTSISADGVSQNLGQRITNFRQISTDYEKKETLYYSRPTLGGVSISDMLATLSNGDRVPDIFRLALTDNPPNLGVHPHNEPAGGIGDEGGVP